VGLTAVVAGGDDYELCFTAPENARDSIEDLTDMLGVPLTRIGQVRKGKGVSLVGADGKPIKVDGGGFDHFTAS
jgi:thiamine-monophosphate kinase